MFRYLILIGSLILSSTALADTGSPIKADEIYLPIGHGRCQVIRPSDNGKTVEVLEDGLRIKIIPIEAFGTGCIKLSNAGVPKISQKYIQTAERSQPVYPTVNAVNTFTGIGQ